MYFDNFMCAQIQPGETFMFQIMSKRHTIGDALQFIENQVARHKAAM
jgi:hypothetical protein